MGMKDTYTTRETAEILGVSLRTVQLWVENGKLEAWKTEGGHRRILRGSVTSLLNKHKHEISTKKKTRRLQVVLVEDEIDTLSFYSLQIKAMNLPIDIYPVENGFNGLLEIGSRNPDILITDLIMPHVDGFQLIRTLRNNPEYSHIETIVVTALSDEQINQNGGLPSTVKILHKPLPFDALKQLFVEQLGGKVNSPAATLS